MTVQYAETYFYAGNKLNEKNWNKLDPCIKVEEEGNCFSTFLHFLKIIICINSCSIFRSTEIFDQDWWLVRLFVCLFFCLFANLFHNQMPLIYGTRYLIIHLQGFVAKKIYFLIVCLFTLYTNDDKRYVHSRGNTKVALIVNLKEEGKV